MIHARIDQVWIERETGAPLSPRRQARIWMESLVAVNRAIVARACTVGSCKRHNPREDDKLLDNPTMLGGNGDGTKGTKGGGCT